MCSCQVLQIRILRDSLGFRVFRACHIGLYSVYIGAYGVIYFEGVGR